MQNLIYSTVKIAHSFRSVTLCKISNQIINKYVHRMLQSFPKLCLDNRKATN